MTIEILNTIKRSGDKWEYTGRFRFNGQWIPITGKIGSYKTESQYKRAIIAKAKEQSERYKRQIRIPSTKVLAEDTIFKAVI